MFFTAARVRESLHCKTNKHNSLSCLHCFPFSFALITYLFHSPLSSSFLSFWPIFLLPPSHFSFLLTPSLPLFSHVYLPFSLNLTFLFLFITIALSLGLSVISPDFWFYFHPFPSIPLLLPLLPCRVWEVTTGEVLNTLIHHNEAVLHLRFANGLMVTCSKDRSIAVWDMASPTDISLRRVLVGHRAAVNVVDFDDKYIVSASGDRTIKVTSTQS